MTVASPGAIPRALDLAQPLTGAQIDAAALAGVQAICRYLSNSPAKNLSLAEAQRATLRGIKCVVVWEAQGNHYASFTAAQGSTDASRAEQEALVLGIPKGSTIYFCGADFDATDAEIAGGIAAYMRSVNTMLADSGYLVGVYGNGALCKAMLDAGLATKAWLWGAMGTNGTRDFSASNRWSIRQHPTVREFGVSVDPDDVQGDYGGFFVALPGAPVQASAQPEADDPVPEAVKALQTALQSGGYYTGAIDGDWGAGSAAALAGYLRSKAAA